MGRRDFRKAWGRGLILSTAVGLAAALSACANFVPPASDGAYPKFSDIPLKAEPTTPLSQAEANAAILRGVASQLAAQSQGIASAPSNAEALAAARATASQVQAPTDADAAATETFVRAARARATPPPVRK